MKRCGRCHEIKEESEFRFQSKILNKRYSKCKACEKKYRNTYLKISDVPRAYRERFMMELANKVYDYLLKHPCSCGESNPVVLEFHHLENKDECISRMIRNCCNWEKIILEIKKCIVLCANCHRKHHAKEGNYRMYKIQVQRISQAEKGVTGS